MTVCVTLFWGEREELVNYNLSVEEVKKERATVIISYFILRSEVIFLFC